MFKDVNKTFKLPIYYRAFSINIPVILAMSYPKKTNWLRKLGRYVHIHKDDFIHFIILVKFKIYRFVILLTYARRRLLL